MDQQEAKQYIESRNLAEIYDDPKLLDKMGLEIIEWFDEDEESRSDWKKRNEEWLLLATQVIEKKTWPWPQASNIKFPLLTTAAMQFHARAYPALVPGPKLVQGLVLGGDEQGTKAESAKRVGNHMSYQLLYEMDKWEENMDRLCVVLPIIGCVFKKTYRDTQKNKNCSDLILPNDLVIDYYAKSLEEATRKSHVLHLTKRKVEEKFRKGIWTRIDLGEQQPEELEDKTKDKIDGTKSPKVGSATPYKFIECHCFWDLDDDGYEEPYIVTVHYTTKKVVRIVARFDMDGVKFDTDKNTGKQTLVEIEPTEYFTKFTFIPNPDGSIYDLGFGLLLGSTNEAINTLANQLIDAGTMSNLQAGFLGRGIRIRAGGNRFQPGEWKPVDFTGDDIKKHIFPLPTKEPSDTLFKLFEIMVTSGKEVASIAEIMVGKMPGQNTPATTTMEATNQAMKVFTAIYKRVYKALGCEFTKLFNLNSKYVDEDVYFTINEASGPQSQQVYQKDYDVKNLGVKPNADPNATSSAQKLQKVQAVGPLVALGTINKQAYTKRYLEAIEMEGIQEMMQPNPQEPNPDAQKAQMEMAVKQQDAQSKAQLEQLKLQVEQQKAQMNQKMQEFDLMAKQIELQMKEKETMMDMFSKQAQTKMDLISQQHQHVLDMTQQSQKHAFDLKSMEEKRMADKAKHEQTMKQTKEKAALKPKAPK